MNQGIAKQLVYSVLDRSAKLEEQIYTNCNRPVVVQKIPIMYTMIYDLNGGGAEGEYKFEE